MVFGSRAPVSFVADLEESVFAYIAPSPSLLRGLSKLSMCKFCFLSLQWWPDFVSCCTDLTELTISGPDSIFESLEAVADSCSNLKGLTLCCVSRLHEGCADSYFARLVEKCTHLQQVYLINCVPNHIQCLSGRNVSFLLTTTHYPDLWLLPHTVTHQCVSLEWNDSSTFVAWHNMSTESVAKYVATKVTNKRNARFFTPHLLSGDNLFIFMSYFRGLVKLDVANCTNWNPADLRALLQLPTLQNAYLERNTTIVTIPQDTILGANVTIVTFSLFSAISIFALAVYMAANPNFYIRVYM